MVVLLVYIDLPKTQQTLATVQLDALMLLSLLETRYEIHFPVSDNPVNDLPGLLSHINKLNLKIAMENMPLSK